MLNKVNFKFRTEPDSPFRLNYFYKSRIKAAFVVLRDTESQSGSHDILFMGM